MPPPVYAAVAPPPPPNMPAVVSVLQQAVAARSTTDEQMSALYLLLIILAPILSIFLLIGGLFLGVLGGFMFAGGFIGALALAVIIPGLILVFVFLKMVNRMSNHFRREATLRRAVIDYLRGRATLEGRYPWVAAEVANMEAVNADANAHDTPSSGALAILAIIPIARWYLLYVLTKWPSEHEPRWVAFVQQAGSAAAKLGLVAALPIWNPVPRRSFALYLILSLFIPFFSLYWYYVLLKDPNEHFKGHAQVEDAFAAIMR